MGNRLSHSRRSTLLFASSYLHLGTPLPWLSECGISDIGRPSLPTRINQRSNRDRCTGFAARAAAWSMQLARPHGGPVVSHLLQVRTPLLFFCVVLLTANCSHPQKEDPRTMLNSPSPAAIPYGYRVRVSAWLGCRCRFSRSSVAAVDVRNL